MKKELKKYEYISNVNIDMNKTTVYITLVFLATLGFSCKKTYLPKPKGYNRIELKPATYKSLPDSFPFYFEFAERAEVTSDNSWISERFWFDINYPNLNATIQVTYKPINKDLSVLRELLDDSYRLTSKHNVKAYAIDEIVVPLQNGMTATMMELSGEVPSQFQFHITDSIEHFVRCALYFKTSTKNDSLKPVIDYIKQDMVHMANTLEWK